MPPKLIPALVPELGSHRYRVFRGGRGGGKSFSVALMAAIWGAREKLRILCVREFQNSIRESMHAEIKNAIQSNEWLASEYDIGVDYLRHKYNGTEFIFKGLKHNIEAIKSMAQIDLCIAEEAETIPHTSWQGLIPTVRSDKSEIIIIYNPRRKDSWVAQTFPPNKPHIWPPRSIVTDINYSDNPWFPAVLDEERKHHRTHMDPALYAHIWEGDFYELSEATVFFNKFQVQKFIPNKSWSGPYFGLDFGFASDPTAGVKLWIYENNLYVEHEAYNYHLETDDMAQVLIATLPEIEKHACKADNARPETISYLRRHGLPRMRNCKKGKGSVEDGIAHIKSFEKVYIHPRCTNALKEFSTYSYKTDRLSGDILPILIDENNHLIDAIRYALEPLLQGTRSYLTRAMQ